MPQLVVGDWALAQGVSWNCFEGVQSSPEKESWELEPLCTYSEYLPCFALGLELTTLCIAVLHPQSSPQHTELLPPKVYIVWTEKHGTDCAEKSLTEAERNPNE